MKKKFTYHWVILLCGIILSGSTTGILSYFNALFVEPVTAALGVNKSTLMLYSTIGTVTSMIGSPIAGSLYKRFKFKPLMLAGIVFGAAALSCYAFSPNVYGFYVGGFFYGCALSLCSGLPMTIIINNWFVASRGTVIGIAYTGSALVSALLSAPVTNIIANNGYSAGYQFLLTLFLATMLPVTLLILRVTPGEMGLKPYGEESSSPTVEQKAEGFTRREAMATPAFWLFSVSVFLLGLITFGTQQFLIANWTSRGVEATLAASLYSVVMIASACSKLFLGGLYDKLGMAKGSAILCAVAILAQISLATITRGWGLMASAVMFGLMTSMQVLVTSYGSSRMFGTRDYSNIFGLECTFLYCGVGVGVYLTSLIFDITGGYRLAWWSYGGLMVVCMVCLLLANSLSQKMYREKLGIERAK